MHPHNWALKKKVLICFIVGLSALSIALGSAMFSESSEAVME
jgi:DHA1 family multidrug resistance protein-like MFS transporter